MSKREHEERGNYLKQLRDKYEALINIFIKDAESIKNSLEPLDEELVNNSMKAIDDIIYLSGLFSGFCVNNGFHHAEWAHPHMFIELLNEARVNYEKNINKLCFSSKKNLPDKTKWELCRFVKDIEKMIMIKELLLSIVFDAV